MRDVDYLEEGWRRGEPLYFAMRQIQGRYAPYAGARANVLHYLQSGRPLESEQLMDVPIRRGMTVLDVRSRFFDHAELFTDPDHLNSRGAKLLAADINTALGRLAANPG